MQMRPDLPVSVGANPSQDVGRPWSQRDLIGDEVRGPDPETPQHAVEARQLTNVIHGYPGPRRRPVVLLRIDRHDERDGPSHARCS